MLFNSYIFIFFFLPIAFFGYFLLQSKRYSHVAKVWLVGCSLFFYSWWNVSYLPLILVSLIVNYMVGSMLQTRQKRGFSPKLLLSSGLLFNILLLGYFKYRDFFIENINTVFATDFTLLHLMLPLAISFFTFQQIAYLVDCYQKEGENYSFINYTLFVTFFPQLIAGPIVHHKEMMPQFASSKARVKQYKHIALGLFIFSIGLFKKVVIADSLSPIVAQGFDVASTLTLLEGWIVSLAYTFQLYFDFSGYTDMAIGAALLFNIRLPQNFNSPYKALSIQDFWRRWHMTLSRFLRDYIYIPLGGNRQGQLRMHINLLLTFLIGGFWHGAGWTFIFWGFLHGAALVVHRMWSQFAMAMPTWLAWFLTFNFINITWVFFRAQNFDDALKVLKAMAGMQGIALPHQLERFGFLHASSTEFGGFMANINGDFVQLAYLIAAMMVAWFFANSSALQSRFKATKQTFLLSMLLFSVAFMMLNRMSEFLYFNF